MIYCYRCAACDARHELDLPIGTAPDTLAVDGVPSCCAGRKDLVRDYRAEHKVLATGKLANDAKYPYVSRRLPKRLPGCQTDSKGLSVVQNKAHEREICARHEYHRD